MVNADRYRCGALLDGQWLEPRKQWQPPGCLLHKYKAKDMMACLQGRLAFIGDSTIREVFWAMAEKLDATRTSQAMYVADKHSDVTFRRDGVIMDFIWDPYLNSSKLDHHLESFEFSGKQEDKAVILLIGGGLWHAKNLGDLSTKEFGSALDRIMTSIPKYAETATTFAKFPTSQPDYKNLLAISPVRSPQFHLLSPDQAAVLTQDKVNSMNNYLQHLSKEHDAPVIWSFAAMSSGQALNFQKDGLHVVNDIAALQADILLNLRCNAKLSRHGRYPMDKTCCSAYTQPTWVQRAVLISSLGMLLLVTFVAVKGGLVWNVDSRIRG